MKGVFLQKLKCKNDFSCCSAKFVGISFYASLFFFSHVSCIPKLTVLKYNLLEHSGIWENKFWKRKRISSNTFQNFFPRISRILEFEVMWKPQVLNAWDVHTELKLNAIDM
ncbi:hypothetical protein L6164_008442 [Bauhinia variegata]|uniref:Uncharacterized protein n=1 Tax=Bauhinia variegata TaxID=167791 RepID=A0ACB9PFW9_BAUVA|nr:hypothetical protein L6164_008442 [Bauhinia variegata]